MIPVAVLTVAGATFLSAHYVHAQGNSATASSIVQKIAQKFGLKEADVQSVFDEERQQHMSEMHVKFEGQLTQDVKDGKITEAQKQLILAKSTEFETLHETQKEAFKNMNPEQRRTAMEAKHAELETWAKQNNIDMKYILGHKGMIGKGRGMGMMKMKW